jgi:hypothetical protein
MKIRITLLFAFLFSSLSWALSPEIFKGQWQGTGIYRINGIQSHCHQAEFVFDGGKSFIEFTKGFRNCDNHSEKFDLVRLDYKNSQFYFGSLVVGELIENTMSLRFSAPEADGKIRHWRMSMRREGQNLVYEESRTMEGEVTPLISFVGLLSLKE